jgi:protein-L-isoaspartate(D-aspartate) O-methyltransferase
MEYKHQRKSMVENQIKIRGITDKRVLKAMLEVPRHEFVGKALLSVAYQDSPLPIGSGQTISQPYIVALMTELLDVKDDNKVLEIGTGSGYQAAILSKLAMSVITVERVVELYHQSKELLKKLGYNNVMVVHGDGSIGYKEYAPYDRIIVTAASPEVPESLIEQLGDNGKIVIPLGNRIIQRLEIIIKEGESLRREISEGVRFVPLLGKEAW